MPPALYLNGLNCHKLWSSNRVLYYQKKTQYVEDMYFILIIRNCTSEFATNQLQIILTLLDCSLYVVPIHSSLTINLRSG